MFEEETELIEALEYTVKRSIGDENLKFERSISETVLKFVIKKDFHIRDNVEFNRFCDESRIAFPGVRILIRSSVDIEVVAKAIEANKKITNISFCYKLIWDDDARKLANTLESNRTLKSLDFRGHLSDEGAIAISHALKTNNTLEKLDLQHTQVSDQGAVAIASALGPRSNLKMLDLDYTQISDQTAEAIAVALERGAALKILNFDHAQIFDSGAITLAKVLETNSTVEYLNLNYTQVSDPTAIAFAYALAKNTTLKRLILGHTQISDVGAMALASALTYHNFTLWQLSLIWTQVSHPILSEIDYALEFKPTC